MTHPGLRGMPTQNPCAQCGEPIAMPEWIEEQEDRMIYLWHCHTCDYCFEAIAFFENEGSQHQPLAA
jgi:hypothetical protein